MLSSQKIKCVTIFQLLNTALLCVVQLVARQKEPCVHSVVSLYCRAPGCWVSVQARHLQQHIFYVTMCN